MPGFNVGLLAIELLALASVVFYLHRRSRRFGLAPLLIYLSGLVAVLDTLGPTALFVDVGGVPLEVSNATLVPVILATLLLLYRLNGTAVARVTILGIVGLSILVLFVQVSRLGHLVLGATPGVAELTRRDPVFGGEWRTTVSSITAFLVSLNAVAVADQALLNRVRALPRWMTPGLALLAAAAVDDLVFRVGSFGVHGYLATFPGGLPAKAMGTIVLWPFLALYLRRAAPQVMSGSITDTRPVLDIVFGTYGQRDHALRTTATQLTTVISQAPVVMFALDSRGVFTLSEGAGLVALGLKPGEAVGKSAFDLFPEAADHIRRAQGGEVVSALLRVRDLAWDITYTPMVREGSVVGVSGVATDITAKVRAEAALTETKRRFQSTFEQAAVGLAHVDTRGHVILANRVLSSLVSRSEGELVDADFAELIHPTARPAYRQGLEQLLDGSVDRHVAEMRLMRPDRSDVWVGTTLSLARNEQGAPLYFIVVVEDLTARRAVEDQLRQAQKMEAVGQLTGGVAHDFNNLLTVVISGIEMALADVDDPKERGEALNQALLAAQRGAALTQRLLAFSRRQALQPVALHVQDLLGDVKELLVRLMPETIKVRVTVDESVGWCEADRAQIESALINLSVNARDAMPDGGTLTLSAGRVDVRPEDIPVPDAQPGSYVRIGVTDDGLGISEGVRRHVFEPFFTTKGKGKGSGLGLSMVYGFVTQSGGFVTLASEEGIGTEVGLHLPVAPAPPVD